MNLSQRIKNWWNPPKQQAKQMKRLFNASQITKTDQRWTVTPYGANWTLYRDLRGLRARSREAVANQPHFRKFILMAQSNVVGPKGLQLQCQAYMGRGGKLDTKLNKQVGEVFWELTHPENCTVTGKLSWIAAQRLFITHLIRDGECLVQLVKTDNPFGFALKFWNVDYLDETYNDTIPGGNRVIMSVEIDVNDRPVAYWLTTPASEINFTLRRARERTRIPADQMIHSYIVTEDETQVRGVPWFHAALIEGRNLSEYKKAVQNSAKMAAMTGGFFTKKNADEVEYKGEETEAGVEQDMSIDFSELSFHALPDDYDFTQFDPKQPTQNHAEFARQVEHDLAAALGVNYFNLSGDMASVNYSSARVGLREERDVWKMLQDTTADFCRKVYHAWARAALVSKKLVLDERQFREIQNPKFAPRGWGLVDPQKEVKAALDAITGGIDTVTSTLADQGKDLTEFLQEKKSEMEQFAEFGVPYPTAPQPAQSAGEQTGDDDGNQDKKPPKTKGENSYTNGRYSGDLLN